MRTGRVRTRADFSVLRERGLRSRQASLRVLHVPDPAGSSVDPPVRVAFAIGRAVGTAVVRNRLRRRLRAALRELDAAPGLYLISATPAAAERSYSDLQREMASAVAELGAGSAR